MAMVCRASVVFPKSRGSSGSAIRAVAVPPEKVATNDTTSQVSLRLPSSTSSSVQSQLVLMRHGKHSYNNQHSHITIMSTIVSTFSAQEQSTVLWNFLMLGEKDLIITFLLHIWNICELDDSVHFHLPQVVWHLLTRICIYTHFNTWVSIKKWENGCNCFSRSNTEVMRQL